MEFQEFIEHFAEQFEDENIVLAADTKYRELENWSSLLALSVIAMIDEEYDITLQGDEMRKTNTIQELYNLVKSKLS